MLSDAARVLSGQLIGNDARFQRVVTDSRTVQAGDLFVALVGEKFDAHDFVPDVLAKGAYALVSRDVAGQGSVIRVADTRLALGKLAADWCARLDVKRIGITGSNGKTTVKEMVAAILRAHAGDAAVHATAGNFNNDIGLPLTLLGLSPAHRYAVIEMGMNHFGEIRYLTGLARPQVAMVNNAMRAHLGGGFDSTADIARAKSEIFEGLAADGVAVLNADDAQLAIFDAAAAGHAQLRFGLGAAANVTARDIELGVGECRFVLVCPQGEQAIRLPAAGEHNVRNALAAAAVALALDVPLAAIAAGLAAFGGVKGRLQLKQAACGATVIDDTYNANPDSMKAGIDVLAAYPAPRVFVMGQIGELAIPRRSCTPRSVPTPVRVVSNTCCATASWRATPLPLMARAASILTISTLCWRGWAVCIASQHRAGERVALHADGACGCRTGNTSTTRTRKGLTGAAATG